MGQTWPPSKLAPRPHPSPPPLLHHRGASLEGARAANPAALNPTHPCFIPTHSFCQPSHMCSAGHARGHAQQQGCRCCCCVGCGYVGTALYCSPHSCSPAAVAVQDTREAMLNWLAAALDRCVQPASSTHAPRAACFFVGSFFLCVDGQASGVMPACLAAFFHT